jgi:Transglycosylase SLT domain
VGGAASSMRIFVHSYRVVLLSGLFLYTFLPAPAIADQIVAIVDEHGHKVYINTGETGSGVDWVTRSYHPNSAAASNHPVEEIDRLVDQTANRHQVDPNLVRAIVRVESDYDPGAVSNKGAMGLMQLIPATARRFGVENPFDPKQNLEGGVNYLRYLLDLFGGNLSLSLAAYNAGEHSVQRFGGIPAFTETRNYVRKVTTLYQPGDAPAAVKSIPQEPPKAPITRYVDEHGVVHYTNVE